jgi:hypothetical protein
MKTIHQYLSKFAVTILILTIVFRYSLSTLLSNKEFVLVFIPAVLYFLAMFSAGWYFGKKDKEFLPIFDVGFRFHFVTYIVFTLVSEVWFLLGFASKYESIKTIHITAIIWGFLIVIHFIFYLMARKNSINNLDKSDLFE